VLSEDSTPPRVLVADDQPDVLQALRLLLKSEGFETSTATSPAGILDAVEAKDFDAVLLPPAVRGSISSASCSGWTVRFP
jgi:CheY-like chemotaxis protein